MLLTADWQFTMDPIIRYSNRRSADVVQFRPRNGPGRTLAGERYIEVHGREILLIGNNCGTCNFFFELRDGLDKSILAHGDSIAEQLNGGLREGWPEIVDLLAPIFPNGEYLVTHGSFNLSLRVPGEEFDYFQQLKERWPEEFSCEERHDPKTLYFSAGEGVIEGAFGPGKYFYFVIPTVPLDSLDNTTISEYRLRLERGERPTALAISVLDITDTEGWEPVQTSESVHWCLAHYLLDGHHKAVAASQTSLPLSILSFTSIKHSIATAEAIKLHLQHDALGDRT